MPSRSTGVAGDVTDLEIAGGEIPGGEIPGNYDGGNFGEELSKLNQSLLQPETPAAWRVNLPEDAIDCPPHNPLPEDEARTASDLDRERAERLITTLDSITDAFFTLDREWRFTFVNSEAERLLGRPRAELIGRDFRTGYSAADVAIFEARCRRALATNRPLRFEKFYKPRNAWFAIRAYPSPDGVAVYLLDITGRKRKSAALRESRQRLALAAESAQIGIWDWDVPANKMILDRQMYQLYGICEGDFSDPYEVWRNGLHPEDRERAEAEIVAALEGRKDYHTDFRVTWPNGEVRHIEAHAVVKRAPDGSVRRMIGVNWDITARKRAEQAMEQARRRLSEAQRIGRMGDWEFDLVNRAITWSPQVFEIMGRDPALGQPRDFDDVVEFWAAASKAVIKEGVALAIRSGEPQQYELIARRPDGSEVHVQSRALPVKDKSGQVVGLRGTIQDITARKRGEQAMHHRVLQQELIATLGRTALADTRLDRLLAEAASAVAGGFGTGYSAVLQFIAADTAFVPAASVGFDPEWLGRPLSGAEGVIRLEETLLSGKPVIVPNSGACFLLANGLASGIELAIVSGDGPWGVLGAYSREAGRFGAENADFLQSIVNILATAIDRKHREAQLGRLAHYDPLTDLPNRSLLNERLAAALAQAQESGTRLALLYLDLDDFKNVNDAFGHGLGDRLLQEVARRLTASVRASDTVSRQGGDEFLIVLPEVENEEDAARIAERIVRSMDDPINIDSVELLVRFSVGIACFPDNGLSASTLIRNADAAMYAAKATGQSSYRFYSEEMNAHAHGRLQLEADLSRAIARNELFLQYQSQVAMATGAVTGVEALVRWRHSTLGVVPPGRFIPVAEQSGLIVSIGNWVLEAACRQQAQWVREGIAPGRMAVNVSAVQFRHPAFVDTVVRTLDRAGLDPRYLEMELTESVVMHGIDGVFRKLIGLDKLGVTLAIDDFGTGQSNLSYLRQFPIRRLKIDRSFIAGLPADTQNGALTQAIIGMGHALGMNVIAEGIETREQAEYLQSLWCDDAQGFFFSRPLSPAACAEFLRSEKILAEIRAETEAEMQAENPIPLPLSEEE